MSLPMEFPSLSHLPGAARDALTDWLADCDLNWQDGQIAVWLLQLPAELLPLRGLALVELVKIDLVQMWRRGREVLVESYLVGFPEFGTSDSIAPDLIVAEIDARQRSARPATDNEIAERFPQQIEAVRLLVSGTSLLKESETLPRTVLEAQKRTASVSPVDTDMPTAKDTHSTITVGAKFGLNERYEILKKLGGGGMGSVYLATDCELGDRKVAIKVPRFAPADGPEMLDRFKREAALLAALSHPNLGIVFDVNQYEGTSYLVMEFIDGQSLGEYAKSHLLTPPQAVSIVRQVASALRTAHAAGVVHRDMKPENIMLTKTRQPKVIDFGLAVDVNRSGPRATQTGTTMGTPEYMPIEQLRGDLNLIGPRSDVYSLGVVLFKLLTDMVPFSGDNAVQVFEKLANDDVPSPQLFCPDLDPALTEIVLKAIAKQPADRYETMAAFEIALAAYLNKPPDTNNIDSRVSEMIPGQLGGQSLSSLSKVLVRPGERGGVSPPVFPAIALPKLTGGLTPPRSPISRVFQSRTRIAVALTTAAAILLGAILWFRSGEAIVKIEVLSDDVAVSFQRKSFTISDGEQQYRVQPGEHRLHIQVGNAEFDTDAFKLKKGNDVKATIEWVDSKVIAKLDDATIGSFPAPATKRKKPKRDHNSNLIAPPNVAKAESPRSNNESEIDPNPSRKPSVLQGKWWLEGDELVTESVAPRNFIAFGDPQWTDYDLKVEASCDKVGVSYNLVLRWSNDENFWLLQFGNYGAKNLDLVAFVSEENGWKTPSRRYLPSSLHGEAKVWHNIEVKARGDNITVIVDGRVMTTSSHPKLTRGCVGMHTFSPGNARWRNLEVRTPDGKLLWKGFPTLPPEQLSETAQSYQAASKAADEFLRAEFDKVIERTRTEKSDNAESAQQTLAAIQEEQADFQSHQRIPFSSAMRAASITYLERIGNARKEFEVAIGRRLADLKDSKAPTALEESNTLAAEKTRYLAPRVIGIWELYTPNGVFHDVILQSDGTITRSIGQLPGTWTLDAKHLLFTSPRPGNAGGNYVDTNIVSDDGRTYSGRNQLGYKFTGKLKRPPGIGVIKAETTKRFATWALSRGGEVIVPGGKSIDLLSDGMILHLVRFEMDPEAIKPLEDADLDHFQDLPGVENTLGFRRQNLTSAGLIKLGAMMQKKQISHLGLVDMPVGLSAFRQPGGFAAITGGTFQNVVAKDDELIHLRNLKSLAQLNLRFNKEITDAGLPHLGEMKTLKHLALEGTSVTIAGVAKLQAALPDCEITTSLPGPSTAQTEGDGSWKLDESDDAKTLVCESAGGGFQVRFGDLTWTDLDFHVDCLQEEGRGNVFLYYRCVDKQNTRQITLGSFGNAYLGADLWTSGVWNGLAGVPWSMPLNEWQSVRISVRGDRAEVFLNNESRLSGATGTHPKGMVGIGTGKGRARFRNLKVTSPTGEILWQGFPKRAASDNQLQP